MQMSIECRTYRTHTYHLRFQGNGPNALPVTSSLPIAQWRGRNVRGWDEKKSVRRRHSSARCGWKEEKGVCPPLLPQLSLPGSCPSRTWTAAEPPEPPEPEGGREEGREQVKVSEARRRRRQRTRPRWSVEARELCPRLVPSAGRHSRVGEVGLHERLSAHTSPWEQLWFIYLFIYLTGGGVGWGGRWAGPSFCVRSVGLSVDFLPFLLLFLPRQPDTPPSASPLFDRWSISCPKWVRRRPGRTALSHAQRR